MVSEALEKNARVLDSFSPEGFTPLMLAAHFGHKETVEALLVRGADLNVVSSHEIGVTALHAALFGRRREVAELLVKRGADLNIRRRGAKWPRSGWTALHYAASQGYSELIELLLPRGADPNVEDDQGKRPMDIALETNQHEVAGMLTRNTGPD